MHDSSKKKPEHSSHNSTSVGAVSCPSWWNSTCSEMPHSSLTSSLNLSLDTPMQKQLHVKQLGCRLQDQDSSSTQSTGQSHHDSGTIGRGSLETSGEQVDRSTRQVGSPGSTDFLFPAAQVNFSQSVVHIPYAYADPLFGGLMSAYRPQIHTQLYGVAPNRVPLPDLADEPVYVNAKQYRGILRRRESRAKLEAQNKLVKARKVLSVHQAIFKLIFLCQNRPYLHESRHRHAMKRARGSGGRFLNTKECEDSKTTQAMDGENGKNLSVICQGHCVIESEVPKRENGNSVSSATLSCSGANISDNDGRMLRQRDMGYGAFHSLMVGSLQEGGGILHNGAQRRVPGIR